MLYLWQIPRESEIWLDEGAVRVIFHHTDGLFSYCTGIENGDDNAGKVLNLSRFTPLVKVEEHYEISDESEV